MKSIRNLFIVVTVVVSLLVFSLQGLYTYLQTKDIVAVEVENTLKYQSLYEAKSIENTLNYLGNLSEAAANNMEIFAKDPNGLLQIMSKYVLVDKMIFGGGYWYEPYVYDKAQKYYGPYVIKKDEKSVAVTWEYSNAAYDYHSQDWYKVGLNSKHSVAWSNPFYDDLSKTAMVSIVAPVKNNGKVTGVASIDVGLKEINDYVAKIKVAKTGYAFIISESGQYLGHPVQEKNMKETITADKNPEVKKVGEQVLKTTEFKIVEANFDNKDSYVSMAPIGNTGMKLVMIMPKAEVFGALNKLIFSSIISFIVSILLLFTSLTFFFTRKISNPLKEIENAANKVASGELSTEIPVRSEDEIGVLARSLKIMVENLNNVVTNVRQSSEQVSAASEELTASAEQSALAATQVAEAITEVAAATDSQLKGVDESAKVVEKINFELISLAKQMDSTNNVTHTTSKMAGEGSNTVLAAIRQMGSIEGKVNELSVVINKLGDYSGQIGQIVDSISSISSQTNLLALNAAIEAARAGESGRGFAVVADEVRKLAEQSQLAAKQIAGLIKEIQNDTQVAVVMMGAGNKEVTEGKQIVGQAGESFTSIVKLIQNIANEINTMLTSVKEVNQGSNKLVDSVKNIGVLSRKTAEKAETVAAATEEQSATMQEIAASSKVLAHMSEDLNQTIEKISK